jgi:hypothetical protein
MPTPRPCRRRATKGPTFSLTLVDRSILKWYAAVQPGFQNLGQSLSSRIHRSMRRTTIWINSRIIMPRSVWGMVFGGPLGPGVGLLTYIFTRIVDSSNSIYARRAKSARCHCRTPALPICPSRARPSTHRLTRSRIRAPSPSRVISLGFARISRSEGRDDRYRSKKGMKTKSRRLKAPASARSDLLSPRSAATRSPDYFWMLA